MVSLDSGCDLAIQVKLGSGESLLPRHDETEDGKELEEGSRCADYPWEAIAPPPSL